MPTVRYNNIPLFLVIMVYCDSVKDGGVFIGRRHFFSKDDKSVLIGDKCIGCCLRVRIITEQARPGVEVDGGPIDFRRQVVRAVAPALKQEGECCRHGCRYAYDAREYQSLINQIVITLNIRPVCDGSIERDCVGINGQIIRVMLALPPICDKWRIV